MTVLIRDFDANLKFQAYTPKRFQETQYWNRFSDEYKEIFDLTVRCLPFRVNDFVLENLICWDDLDTDPMFRLLFPQKGMLNDHQMARLKLSLTEDQASEKQAIFNIRSELNPHPSGQMTDNAAYTNNEHVEGTQHKYRETMLFFPSAGQTCHAYCSFCFRWPQFVGEPQWKIQAKETKKVQTYLRGHLEITDILITGGDPMIMNTKVFERYIDSFLEIESVRNIRIGTKAITYWPTRFVGNEDADALMRVFSKIVASGRHLAIMAHINHWKELEPGLVQSAIRRIGETGAVIRTQAPLLQHINDDADVWARLWKDSVKLGMNPYYMFVERDTGPSAYFRVPLVRASEIYINAISKVSGLARAARGPVMSADIGKVVVDGVIKLPRGPAVSLRLLQARDPNLIGKLFLANYDETACWIDELNPIDGTESWRKPRVQ